MIDSKQLKGKREIEDNRRIKPLQFHPGFPQFSSITTREAVRTDGIHDDMNFYPRPGAVAKGLYELGAHFA